MSPTRSPQRVPPRWILALPLPGQRVIVVNPSRKADARYAILPGPFFGSQALLPENRPAWLPLGSSIDGRPLPDGGVPRRPTRARAGAVAGRAAGALTHPGS